MTEKNAVIWSQNVAKSLHKFQEGAGHFSLIHQIFKTLKPDGIHKIEHGGGDGTVSNYNETLREIISSLIDTDTEHQQYFLNE